MGLVEHIHPFLRDAEYERTDVKIYFVFGAFCVSVFIYILTTIVSTFSATYQNLRRKEQVFWNLAILRSLYGIFGVVFGFWSIFVDTDLEKDVVFATSPTGYFTITTTVGFFVFECLAVLVADILNGSISVLLHLHHWVALVNSSMVLVYENTQYLGSKSLILEMSTPFSAICWILLKAGKSSSLLWKANQFVLVHTFHLRSVIECYMWYKTYQHWDRIWEAMPWPNFILTYTQLALITFLMTPYWTYKKSQQMIIPADWNFRDEQKESVQKKRN